MMHVVIEVRQRSSGQSIVSKTLMVSEQGILLGKSSDADVSIPFDFVSRKHCRIFLKNEQLWIEDLNSTNGCVYVGKKLEAGKPQQLQKQTTFFIANELEIIITQVASVNHSGSFDIIKKLQQKNQLTIGRDNDCDITVSDDPTISRKHAIITIEKGKYFIEDLNSTNGTYLNGKQITSKHSFSENDKVIVGRTVIPIHGKPENLTDEIAVEANGISKIFRNGKTGLKEVSFEIQGGSMVAIMGPSGCGKSTVLKALAGYNPASKGSVKLFGLDLIKDYDFLKTAIGYVPQDDTIHQQLTVYQALYYSGRLRLENLVTEKLEAKITKVLNRLGIHHIKDQLISEISGGQRKRVCIAVELLTDPLILFLDEPTSPLDPQTIDDFMSILKSLADHGTTIILVTHKPEDLQFMDRVIFMAQGGILAYDGKLDDAMHYFKVFKVNEIYKKLADSGIKPWGNKVKTNGINNESKKLKHIRTGSMFHQWNILTARNFHTKFNDLNSSFWLLLQAPVIALLICFILPDITSALPFLIAVCAIWFGCNNASKEIVLEQPIYLRERMYNLAISPYVVSKFTFLGILCLLQSASFIIILKLWFSYGDITIAENEFLYFNNPLIAFLWMFTVSMVASAMGLVLSAWAKNSEKVMTILPLLLIPQIIFSGGIAPFKNAFVELLSYTVLARWANHGQQLIQKEVLVKITDSIKGEEINIIKSAEKIISQNYYCKDCSSILTIQFDIFVVSIMFIIFTIVLFELLRSKDPFRR